jgi:hypothetical protein
LLRIAIGLLVLVLLTLLFVLLSLDLLILVLPFLVFGLLLRVLLILFLALRLLFLLLWLSLLLLFLRPRLLLSCRFCLFLLLRFGLLLLMLRWLGALFVVLFLRERRNSRSEKQKHGRCADDSEYFHVCCLRHHNSAWTSAMLHAKLPPPQSPCLECVQQLLCFRPASSLLTLSNPSFFSHLST